MGKRSKEDIDANATIKGHRTVSNLIELKRRNFETQKGLLLKQERRIIKDIELMEQQLEHEVEDNQAINTKVKDLEVLKKEKEI